MGEFFPKVWENTKFFPNFSDKFVPKIGESPNLSSNFGTNSSPNLVNPQISPQLSGQIRPQIWWFPKFVLKFGEIFFPKFGESPNLSPNFGTNSSPNLGNPQICPQISGQIRPQICPQKAREHTSLAPHTNLANLPDLAAILSRLVPAHRVAFHCSLACLACPWWPFLTLAAPVLYIVPSPHPPEVSRLEKPPPGVSVVHSF